MKNFTKIAAAGVVAMSATLSVTSAAAAPFDVSGTFLIDIYNYSAGGVRADAAATVANRDGVAGDRDVQIEYTGSLNFGTFAGASTTIAQWLNSNAAGAWAVVGGAFDAVQNGGFVDGDAFLAGTTQSTSSFQTTTMFDITAKSLDIGNLSQIVNVRHDDGMLLADNEDYTGGVTNRTSNIDGGPTGAINTAISGLSGGAADFNLLYVAANTDPSVLQVQAVPLPAAAWLLLAASGGLIAAKRRRAAQA
jgi:hypothetical protein